MSTLEAPHCAFDTPCVFNERLIRIRKHCFSVISSPQFSTHHALVIPTRHVEHLFELNEHEAVEYHDEVARLTRIAAGLGRGYQTLVKYQPDQPENGIKMNHLHTHVYPRQPGAPLIAGPRQFDDMIYPSTDQISASRILYQQPPEKSSTQTI